MFFALIFMAFSSDFDCENIELLYVFDKI